MIKNQAHSSGARWSIAFTGEEMQSGFKNVNGCDHEMRSLAAIRLVM
jgi:hypothetical protein